MLLNDMDYIYSEFPPKYLCLIPSMLNSAYHFVESLYKENPVFDTPGAHNGKGDIIAYAVEYGMIKLIETGQLPFTFKSVSFEKPTGKYLQIQLPHSTLSINQIISPHAMPRLAQFRNNRTLNNQLMLPGFEIEEDNSTPHMLLVHGYQNLNFAFIGIPHPTNKSWVTQTPNLMLQSNIDTKIFPEEEAVNIEVTISLKEIKNQCIKMIKD